MRQKQSPGTVRKKKTCSGLPWSPVAKTLSSQCRGAGFDPWSGNKHFLGGAMVKNLPANAGDAGSIPGSGRSPRGGNGNALRYSCLETPMNRGVWWATVHGVTKSQTRLSTQETTVSSREVDPLYGNRRSRVLPLRPGAARHIHTF